MYGTLSVLVTRTYTTQNTEVALKYKIFKIKEYTFFYTKLMFPRSLKAKHFFNIPTDAHIYKIIGTLKTIKIPTITPTCFGSRMNHHQGAISCLAKTTIMILLCSSLMTWSMLWRHTSLLCKRAVYFIT